MTQIWASASCKGTDDLVVAPAGPAWRICILDGFARGSAATAIGTVGLHPSRQSSAVPVPALQQIFLRAYRVKAGLQL